MPINRDQPSYPGDPNELPPDAEPAPPSAPTPPGSQGTTPPGGGGGGGGGTPSAIGGVPWPEGMAVSPTYNFQAAPGFKAPRFQAPTAQNAWNDPGYQFRLQSGSDALQRSAAARGVLRTGGTLKDLSEYGQNFAAQEYGNIYNRALQDYNTQYTAAKDEYAPGFADWQMKQAAEKERANAEFQRQWDLWALDNNMKLGRDQIAGQVLATPPPS